ncbi:cytochrome c peroxidase [Paraflavitalea sp. CAU 1676]|uniref:cytochrome-c peroxidase n=1 Tax=Paraflavitalea sp. CAU 1676 TaxID=3032598 RepID=UPI0023DA6A12|nr:cytochrome c peroxidase [Paraflavitalea sp. CAU 1676]MDF2191675.1 cytochrome c peroxidase [Paraflavitalea sp. CAU 1676]
MKKFTILYIILGILLTATLSGFLDYDPAQQWHATADSTFPQPANFPAPVYKFANNKYSTIKVELGRRLFYDGQLSKNGTISCGTCHIQSTAFSHHGHRLSHGINDSVGSRNAPPLQNLAWATSFMWDGGVSDLDLQPLVPISSHVEMGESIDSVLYKLRRDPYYPAYFGAAFGSRDITTARLMQALSQFMTAMISANSKYDRVMRGEGPTFTPEEAQGYTVFKAQCASCHKEPFFTDHSFRNNGLYPYSDDVGRMTITTLPADKYRFKVPSLRNIALTAPYMHDGRFKNLDFVLQHYTSDVQSTDNLDPLLTQASGRTGLTLTGNDKLALKAFLHTLTDSSFMRNKSLGEVNICPQCIRY